MNRIISPIALCASLLALLFACTNTENTTSETTLPAETVRPALFEKLLGTWQLSDGSSFERWKRNEDGTYQSDVFSVQHADTQWNERAHIYPEKEQWAFETVVNGQNQGNAVKFLSSQLSDSSVLFSNPAHDFPTDVYYGVSKEEVHAFIAGPNQKGGRDTVPFNYIRIK